MQTGRSRSIILSGGVADLFYLAPKDNKGVGKYIPLVDLLVNKFKFDQKVSIGSGEPVDLALIHLDLNDGVRFLYGCQQKVTNMFITWQIGLEKLANLPKVSLPENTLRRRGTDCSNGVWEKRREEILKQFNSSLIDAKNNNATGLQVLRRLAEASHATDGPKLFIIIEGADLVVPPGDIATLPPQAVRKLAILRDWFSDPDFLDGKSTVVMLADSPATIHSQVSSLPAVINIDIPSPDLQAREHYIHHFYQTHTKNPKTLVSDLAKNTAGLSLHAVRQLLVEYGIDQVIPQKAINSRIRDYVRSQLGDDAVEFYRPSHSISSLRGNRKLKQYLVEELIHRLKSQGVGALSAVIVGGPIRGGKTFIFEAVAAEMDMPVLKLGNIRSQWFGQTEVIVAKLRRILRALPSWLIIVDEADALFGRITNEMHATERRLVTQFQEMMSDPELTNKGTWLLMTARIDQLSADIRGEGRGGDLIIPVLDPDDCDRAEFVNDLVDLVSPSEDTSTLHNNLMEKTTGWYAGRFSAVRRAAEAYREILGGNLTSQELLFVIEDTLPPDIEKDRRIQELNALLNCTSRRLLPDKYATGAIQDHRSMWRKELDSLLQRSD
jgi:hypothetical protein